MKKKPRKPSTHWAEDGKDYVYGYMCLIDLECEIGAAMGGNTVYPSVKDLKRCHPSWKDCGIAKVKVEGVSVVREMSNKYYD